LLELLDMRSEVIRPGVVVVRYEVRADHLRTGGVAHGGVIATLLDTSLGQAASTLAPDGLDVVTAQINVNFIRPVWQGEILAARAEIRHSGRKTAVGNGQILTESGQLVATGSATFLYIPATDLRREEGRS